VAKATDGAAPNSPANPYGRSTTPMTANAETISPPNKNRVTHCMTHYPSKQLQTHRQRFAVAPLVCPVCRRTPIVPTTGVWQHRSMAAGTKRTPGLADPTHLSAFDEGDTDLVTVIIETPKGRAASNIAYWRSRGPQPAGAASNRHASAPDSIRGCCSTCFCAGGFADPNPHARPTSR
jgi:hypothetical protein